MLKGNGYCDDLSNVAECNYDGGDCCEMKMKINTERCTECVCYLEETCADELGHPFVADGFCNDETSSIEACMFDGDDCCDYYDFGTFELVYPDTTRCEDCQCNGTWTS